MSPELPQTPRLYYESVRFLSPVRKWGLQPLAREMLVFVTLADAQKRADTQTQSQKRNYRI